MCNNTFEPFLALEAVCSSGRVCNVSEIGLIREALNYLAPRAVALGILRPDAGPWVSNLCRISSSLLGGTPSSCTCPR